MSENSTSFLQRCENWYYDKFLSRPVFPTSVLIGLLGALAYSIFPEDIQRAIEAIGAGALGVIDAKP